MKCPTCKGEMSLTSFMLGKKPLCYPKARDKGKFVCGDCGHVELFL
tara:strand:- start:9573 stop:9710 length:138 start_codon:yes stop_codon:yes gene_type:complete